MNEMTTEWRPFVIGTGIFVCALFAATLLNGGRVFALAGSGLNALPGSFGPFTVTQLSWQDPYEDVKAESSISRVYLARDNAAIEVFLGFRGIQNQGDRLSSPKLMLAEQWNFTWVKPTSIKLANASRIEANWMLTHKGNTTRLVLYWYQVERSTVSGELDYRFRLVKRALLDRRSDGAVVRLATAVADDEPIDKAQERLRGFASDLYPQLVKILPQ